MIDRHDFGRECFVNEAFAKVASEAIYRPCDLARKAQDLSNRAEALDLLCGEIVATLVINQQRGVFQGMQHQSQFEELIERWQERRKKLKAQPDSNSSREAAEAANKTPDAKSGDWEG